MDVWTITQCTSSYEDIVCGWHDANLACFCRLLCANDVVEDINQRCIYMQATELHPVQNYDLCKKC